VGVSLDTKDSNAWLKILVPACIVAVGAIIAALIGLSNHATGASTQGISNINATEPSSNSLATSYGPPSSGLPSPTYTSPTPQPSPSPAPSPILTPQGQAGYTLIEDGTFTIGLSGIDFTTSGWEEGSGSSAGLLYQGDGNWDNENLLFYWTSTATPTPGACDGLANAPNKIGVTGMPKIGDRYCAVQVVGPMLAYMQVTAIDASGVHVEAWLWYQDG
jgi:hypothetical protein